MIEKMLKYLSKNKIRKVKNYSLFKRKDERCPVCNTIVQDSFIRCPECHYELKIKCLNCGKLINSNLPILHVRQAGLNSCPNWREKLIIRL